MDTKNGSLLKAVTQARQHVTPASRAVARNLDTLERLGVTLWAFEHPEEVFDDE